MLEILEVGSHIGIPDNKWCTLTSLNILKSLVREIVREEDISPTIELGTLSVFLSHCLYKAAMVCLADDRVSGGVGQSYRSDPSRPYWVVWV